MANPEAIKQRLEQALGRIESAIESHLEAARRVEAAVSATAERDDEVRTLQAQCERLRGELESMQGEYASLKRLTETVSGRLDKAIGELQTVLEG